MASIQKRPNGKWRARYRDDTGKEHSRHFARKIDAQRYLDGITTAVHNGTYVDPASAKVTLRSFYDEWSVRQVWAAGTLKAMDSAMGSCSFADVPLVKVKRSHVEVWVKTMSSTLAPGTIRTRVSNVRSVFRAAIRDRVLGADPSEGVALPRVRRTELAMVVPTPEEVGVLLRGVDEWFQPFVALAAFAGLRLGEATGVQVGDIDFLRRTLHVRRQVIAVPGELLVTLPKHGSERKVFIPDRLAAMLARHIETVGVHGEERWLLPGAPPSPSSMRHKFRKVAPAGVHPHSMRHFFASGLIAAGCDVVTVQRALGHASASTTLQTYAHLFSAADDRTRSAAGGLMDAALDVPADRMRTDGASSGV